MTTYNQLACMIVNTNLRTWHKNWKTVGLGLIYGFIMGWTIIYFTMSNVDDSRNKNAKLPRYNGCFDKYKDSSLADRLSNNIRIFCWMRVSPEHYYIVKYIQHTWGKRCTRMIFFSSVTDPDLPFVVLNFPLEKPFSETTVVMKYLHENNLMNSYDWFLNASPDMYIIMENLRYVLSGYDPDQKYHFWSSFRRNQAPVFISERVGFVLSRAAAKNFYEIAVSKATYKKTKYPFISWDDFVKKFVTLDSPLESCSKHKHLLNNFEFKDLTGSLFACLENTFYHGCESIEACTSNSIAFHSCWGHQQLRLEFLMYGLQPYGISYNFTRIGKKAPDRLEKNEKAEF